MRVLACIFALVVSTAFADESATFAPVVPGKPIAWPQDSGAHPAYRTEWWYATGWLETPDRQPLGFQITFFRSNTGKGGGDASKSAFDPSQLVIAHAALSDPAYGRLVHDQNIARQGFGLAYAKTGNTDVKLDTWRMERLQDGRYSVDADASGFALHLVFKPTQPPMIQGDAGYSRKGPLPQQASYYYSEPQLNVSGSVMRPGAKAARVEVKGTAWLDHEWSSTLLSPDAVGWDWLGANLDDGAALMAFKVRARDGHAVWAHAALRDAHGHTTQYGPADVDFTPTRQWRSPRTGTRYPVAMTVRVGAMHWSLAPLIDDQELDSRDSTGALYWEGAERMSGSGNGRAYLELTGYSNEVEMEKR